MEVLLSTEYTTPSFVVDGLFNWIFPILWVISVHYCIGDPILHIHPTSTFWCVSFELFSSFSLTACPTNILCPWKLFVLFRVCSPYPWPFRQPLHIKHDVPLLRIHTISFLFLSIASLFYAPLKYLAKKVSSQHHVCTSQQHKVWVPIVLLSALIVP